MKENTIIIIVTLFLIFSDKNQRGNIRDYGKRRSVLHFITILSAFFVEIMILLVFYLHLFLNEKRTGLTRKPTPFKEIVKFGQFSLPIQR